MTPDAFKAALADEADALHRLLQAWFRAEGSDDPSAILARFDEGYTMVTPAGKLLTYAMFSGAVPSMRGTRPTLIMTITEVVVQHVDAGSALVTYHERQTQDSGETLRASTALLLNRADRPSPVWRHLQETFIA